MSETIYFIGDPGPGRMNMLNIIRQFGIEPRRICASEQIPLKTVGEEPLAIVIGPDVEERESYVISIRERQDLAGVPIIARVAAGSDTEVEKAILDGVDDVLVDGAEWHFGAFLVHLGKTEDWAVLRAPQGLAVVGERERAMRIRVASLLRKNGYDVLFAGNPVELIMTLPESSPRIVVSSEALAEEALKVIDSAGNGRVGDGIPWVIFGDRGEAHGIKPVPGIISKVGTIRDIGNTEQLTFVINEVVAPEKPEVRMTPRLLYGTAVRFGAEGMRPNLRGFTYNINNGGVFIRTLVPLPKGSRVTTQFKVPLTGQTVEGIGQVVWVREYADSDGPMSPAGMGLQFVDWKEGHMRTYEEAYGLLRADQEDERHTIQASSVFESILKSEKKRKMASDMLAHMADEDIVVTRLDTTTCR